MKALLVLLVVLLSGCQTRDGAGDNHFQTGPLDTPPGQASLERIDLIDCIRLAFQMPASTAKMAAVLPDSLALPEQGPVATYQLSGLGCTQVLVDNVTVFSDVRLSMLSFAIEPPAAADASDIGNAYIAEILVSNASLAQHLVERGIPAQTATLEVVLETPLTSMTVNGGATYSATTAGYFGFTREDILHDRCFFFQEATLQWADLVYREQFAGNALATLQTPAGLARELGLAPEAAAGAFQGGRGNYTFEFRGSARY